MLILNPMASVTNPPGVPFPLEVEALWVYAQLTDGVGTFRLSAEVRRVYDDDTADKDVSRGEPFDLGFPGGGQLHVRDAVVRLPNVSVRGPGLYEFRLLLDDEPVAAAVTVRVLDGEAGL